jgi:hypothetical protein
MVRAVEGASTTTITIPSVVLVVVVQEVVDWVILLLSLSVLVVDVVCGQLLSARRARVVLFEPRHDALLMKFVLARQIVQQIFICKLIETHLAVLPSNQLRALDWLHTLDEVLRRWYTVLLIQCRLD